MGTLLISKVNARTIPSQLPAGIPYAACPNYPHCDVNRAIVPLPAAAAVAVVPITEPQVITFASRLLSDFM